MTPTEDLPGPALQTLLAAARAARARAYAPYSRFAVGAAVMDEQGRVHAGCNVENAAYPQGWCAETSALAAMVGAGGRAVRAVVVVGEADEPVTPCGGCRQRLREFARDDCPVVVADGTRVRARFTLGGLLPASFGPSHLGLAEVDGGRMPALGGATTHHGTASAGATASGRTAAAAALVDKAAPDVPAHAELAAQGHPVDSGADPGRSVEETARRALACLDLTSLNDADTEADIDRLCARAVGPHGHVAAVCVWPRLAAYARQRLPPQVAVAAVANFPHGGRDIAAAVADVRAIVEAGAQEVDVVLPWREPDAAPALLAAVRHACPGLRLKVILETGELGSPPAIARACRVALDGGADFLKTSTGKVRVNATPEAARALLQAIADDPAARARVGFKPAGGIRTVADAARYMALVAEILGADALNPQRFRIGASGLLDDIHAVLGGGRAGAGQGGY
jgi:deoxyribose-phosphate aldolase